MSGPAFSGRSRGLNVSRLAALRAKKVQDACVGTKTVTMRHETVDDRLQDGYGLPRTAGRPPSPASHSRAPRPRRCPSYVARCPPRRSSRPCGASYRAASRVPRRRRSGAADVLASPRKPRSPLPLPPTASRSAARRRRRSRARSSGRAVPARRARHGPSCSKRSSRPSRHRDVKNTSTGTDPSACRSRPVRDRCPTAWHPALSGLGPGAARARARTVQHDRLHPVIVSSRGKCVIDAAAEPPEGPRTRSNRSGGGRAASPRPVRAVSVADRLLPSPSA